MRHSQVPSRVPESQPPFHLMPASIEDSSIEESSQSKPPIALISELHNQLSEESFKCIYRCLMVASSSEVTEPALNEEWGNSMQRISTPGKIHSITAATYYYFHKTAPTTHQYGAFFALPESGENLRIFWRVGIRYLCRLLTAEEITLLVSTIPSLNGSNLGTRNFSQP